MRSIGLGTLLLSLALPGAAIAQGDGPAIGSDVTDFAVADNQGKEFRLSTERKSGAGPGTIVVLTFWCTTCGSCRRIDGEFDDKAREYADKGVRFLAVDSNFNDSVERVNRFLEKNELAFPVLMDPKADVAKIFGTEMTTTTAVIDGQGKLRYYGGFHGALDAVANLTAGQEVAVTSKSGFG